MEGVSSLLCWVLDHQQLHPPFAGSSVHICCAGIRHVLHEHGAASQFEKVLGGGLVLRSRGDWNLYFTVFHHWHIWRPPCLCEGAMDVNGAVCIAARHLDGLIG